MVISPKSVKTFPFLDFWYISKCKCFFFHIELNWTYIYNLNVFEFRTSPPTSPQCAWNADHQAECDEHILGSLPSCCHPSPAIPISPQTCNALMVNCDINFVKIEADTILLHRMILLYLYFSMQGYYVMRLHIFMCCLLIWWSTSDKNRLWNMWGWTWTHLCFLIGNCMWWFQDVYIVETLKK